MARLISRTAKRRASPPPPPPEMVQEVRDILFRCRKHAQVTQETLALRLGTKRPAICRWENHGGNVTVGTLHRIAEACGMALEIKVRRKRAAVAV